MHYITRLCFKLGILTCLIEIFLQTAMFPFIVFFLAILTIFYVLVYCFLPGSSPINILFLHNSYVGVSWANVAGGTTNNNSNNISKELQEQQQLIAAVTGPYSELCPFYMESGHCQHGDQCQYIHGQVCDMCQYACLHPTNPVQREEHVKVSTTHSYVVIQGISPLREVNNTSVRHS